MVDGLKLDMLPNKFDNKSSWITRVDENNQNITNENEKEYNDNNQYKQNEQSEPIIQDSDTSENIQEYHGQVDILIDNPISIQEITTIVNHKINNFDDIGVEISEELGKEKYTIT